MAIYNTDKYVGQAIDSVIQSFEYAKKHDSDIDCYLIVRNDGSKDNSRAEVLKKVNQYKNVFLFDNEKNVGILKTRRNLFLDAYDFVNKNKIKNEENIFLSFLDSDDLCMPTRVLRQLNEMMSDPTLTACGGQVLLFSDTPDNPYQYVGFLSDYKKDYEAVKVESIFQSSCISPVLSIRYDWVKRRVENMDESLWWANYRMGEDWSFVVEHMADKDFKFKNMDEYLIFYRKHDTSMTSTIEDGVGTDQYHIRNIAMSHMGLVLTDDEHRLLITISPCRHWSICNIDFFRKNQKNIYAMSQSLINKILSKNKISGFYNQQYLTEYTNKILLNIKKYQDMDCSDIPIILSVF